MPQITPDYLTGLLSPQRPPCVSLYQPTHRHGPENQQDPIRYKNLLREMEESLREAYPARDGRGLLEGFRALSGDSHFWNHRTDGLAILSANGRFDVVDLHGPVDELLVVADSFHVKPLLRVLQPSDRFQVLCLSRDEVKLYEASRSGLDRVELKHVPRSLVEALGTELTEPQQTVASYGTGPGKGGREMRHGHGGRRDEVDIDVERFFRIVDRAILEHHSRPSGLPLMLAALPEYHTPFRELSHNPSLMEEGLEVDPDALTLDELRERVWAIAEGRQERRIARLVEGYQGAHARRSGSDDLGELALAAIEGRVGVLLLESGRTVPGRLDAATGRVEPARLPDPTVDDVLDDLAEAVLRTKGEVVVVPPELMPATTGVAGIYRF